MPLRDRGMMLQLEIRVPGDERRKGFPRFVDSLRRRIPPRLYYVKPTPGSPRSSSRVASSSIPARSYLPVVCNTCASFSIASSVGSSRSSHCDHDARIDSG